MTAMPEESRMTRAGMSRRQWLGGVAAAGAAAVAGCARRALSPDERKLFAEADQALRELEERGIRADPYRAGRTMTMSRRGIVATSHVLASQAGLDMLKAGGSAMDAAIAAAAVLAVVEPMSTGLDGDAFFIYHEAATGKLHGLNGSGRSPRGLSHEHLASLGKPKIEPHSWEAVTVPGAFDAYVTGMERFGRKPLADVLAPAIDYARNGFAVTETVAGYWEGAEQDMRVDPMSASTWLIDGRAPRPAEVFRNPNLADTLDTLAAGGRDAFYRGPIADQIVRYAGETGGYLTMQDFAEHASTWVDPITTNYRGYDCHQIPPNGQGIGVLIMLNILEAFDLASMKHNSAEYLHLLIEAKKLAYADMYTYVADPAKARLPVAELISKDYAARRRRLIDPRRAAEIVHPGTPTGTDTIYLTTIDADGNACSFINSTYYGFGSKITGGETGIPLQNRGAGFTLEPGHLNEYAPAKRPYHTIIPGMVTRGGKLYLSYGLMGGPMQPQGHLQ
jgi:gamma-glutamyltranspeptidase/glutathione hydrolase